ncbi:MAG: hypothetical protein R3Y61_01580 [Rikenellaceae bacterium]
MKKIFLIATAALFAVACGSTPSDKKTETKAAETAEVVTSEAAGLTVAEFISTAEGLVGKEVTLGATVKHTCKHSGRRCFIFDKADPATTIRVEAGGEIGGFNAELVATDILVTGIVMESRISDEKLAEMEAEYLESIEKDGTEEHCGSELQNVQSVRAKLKAEGKDYHSTYYLNGTKFSMVE